MADYNYPTDRIFMPRSFIWGFRDNSRTFDSQLSGATQTTSVPGARWACSLIFENQIPTDRAKIEGFFTLIRREHRIVMPRLDRKTPLGTINTSGVTASAIAQFARVITLNNCGANKTMLAGSMFKIGNQLFMCAIDATANGSGVMTVSLAVPARNATANSTPVTLLSPTTKWIYGSTTGDYARSGQIATGLTIDLIEAF